MHFPTYPIFDVSQTLKVRAALAIGPETSTASAKLERTAERASCPLSHATVPDLRGKLGYDIHEHSHVFGFQTASVAEQPCRIRNRSRSPARLLRSRAPADGTPSVGLEVLGRAPRISADLGEQRRHIPGRFPAPRSGRRHDHAQLGFRDYWSSNIYAQSRFGDLQSKNRYGWLGKGVEHSDCRAALCGAAHSRHSLGAQVRGACAKQGAELDITPVCILGSLCRHTAQKTPLWKNYSYAKASPNRLNPSRWKSTRGLPTVSRARDHSPLA